MDYSVDANNRWIQHEGITKENNYFVIVFSSDLQCFIFLLNLINN
jgi:hypothetical protein